MARLKYKKSWQLRPVILAICKAEIWRVAVKASKGREFIRLHFNQ
jgi:hypothetical protein